MQKNMLRAKLYIEKHNFEKAATFYEKAVRVDASYENVYDYVLFLMKEKQFNLSIDWLEKLRAYDLCSEKKANVLNRLGIVYRNLKRMDDASKAYSEALVLRKALVKKDADKYSLDLAWTYNNLGVLHEASKVYEKAEKAEKAHMQAYRLRTLLAKKNPKKYKYFVTCSMHNLAELYTSMNDRQKAKILFEEAIALRRELFDLHPDKYMYALASTLHELATLQSSLGNLEVSEILYLEALKYRRSLAGKNPQAYEDVFLDTLKGLKILYEKSGYSKKAKKLEDEVKNAA